MAFVMKKRIDTLDRDLKKLLVFSTGALAANALRARRQASFTTDLHRAIIAVVIALLLFSAVLLWNAIRPAATSKKDRGPEATDVPIGQFHSADRLRSLTLLKIIS